MIGYLADLFRRPPQVRARRGADEGLAALFEVGAAGIAEIDLASGRFVRVNRRFCDMTGRDAAELMTLRPADIIHPDDREAAGAEAMEAMRAAGQWEAELRGVRPDGSTFWGRLALAAWKRDENGLLLCAILVMLDVTETMRAKEQTRHHEELLRLSQMIGRIGSFARDMGTSEISCGPETRAMLGLPQTDGPIDMETWMSATVLNDRLRVIAEVDAALKRGDLDYATECRFVRRDDGRVRHIDLRARYFYDDDGRPLRSVGVLIDVTERKEAEDRMRHAARHDPLTGAANHALFRDWLTAACARLGEGDGFAVLCLDLDRFKYVNDTFGHLQGDQVLVEAAARVRAELAPDGVLARMGGDEFATIQKNLRDPEDAGRLARRIVERMAEPFLIDGQRVTVGASVGVAIAPRHGAGTEDILHAADLALRQAKAQPTRGWRCFEPQMTEVARQRREFEQDLRKALRQGEFELFYQPVLDISTLRVARFEALIRWRHPERGLVPPDCFIPLCEEIGLIVEVGDWVLRRACADAAQWPASIGVAVNISAVQVAEGDLDEVVAAALAETGLSGERLELEITETALMKEGEATLSSLRKVKALGVQIALDDFGAGHSSLGYLQNFPFDRVKIDRAFACGVDRSAKSAAIVKAILSLCSALELETTIEGVETEAQFRTLAEMGGSHVQGYLFSRPQPLEQVPALLEQFGGALEFTRAAE